MVPAPAPTPSLASRPHADPAASGRSARRGPLGALVSIFLLLWGTSLMSEATAEDQVPPDFDKLWDYGHPDQTQARFEALLPQAREAGDPSYLAQLLTQIARAQGLQGQTDEAHRTLDQAEALLAEGMVVARVRYLLERGRAHNGIPRPWREGDERAQAARPFFLQAWEEARQGGADAYAIDAAHMMAIVEPPDSALEWNKKALAVAEASTDERARGWRGAIYNNLGWTLFERGDHAGALELFEKALAVRQEQGKPEAIRIARWCVAKAMRVLGRVEEALALQQQNLAELQQSGGSDGYVHEELGECLLALGRLDAARPHFAAAHALLSEDAWFRENEAARLDRLQKLGRAGADPAPDTTAPEDR